MKTYYAAYSLRSLWNLVKKKIVVNVKNKSIESNKMNLLIVAKALSNKTISVTKWHERLDKPNSWAVYQAKGTIKTPKEAKYPLKIP